MAGPYVCDLTFIMRTRLLFGLYNRRAVSPGWQTFAKVYCLLFSLTFIAWAVTCFKDLYWKPVWWLYVLPGLILYTVAVVASLWTEDEYIYSFYSLNRVTDATLDSSMIFNRLNKWITKTFIATILIIVTLYGMKVTVWYKGGITTLVQLTTVLVLDQLLICLYSTKLLVFSLFYSRILILRRRLERCGFRTIGRAPRQPYCQIYDEILRGLNATDHPLKLLLFFDLIAQSVFVIGDMYYYINELLSQIAAAEGKFILLLVILAVQVLRRYLYAFGHVALLESAATHCDAMAVFTAVQLIKTPTEEDRRHMYWFLRVLERRGARYRVLRALPLNACLVLAIIGFCSSQAIVLINMIQYHH